MLNINKMVEDIEGAWNIIQRRLATYSLWITYLLTEVAAIPSGLVCEAFRP